MIRIIIMVKHTLTPIKIVHKGESKVINIQGESKELNMYTLSHQPLHRRRIKDVKHPISRSIS